MAKKNLKEGATKGGEGGAEQKAQLEAIPAKIEELLKAKGKAQEDLRLATQLGVDLAEPAKGEKGSDDFQAMVKATEDAMEIVRAADKQIAELQKEEKKLKTAFEKIKAASDAEKKVKMLEDTIEQQETLLGELTKRQQELARKVNRGAEGAEEERSKLETAAQNVANTAVAIEKSRKELEKARKEVAKGAKATTTAKKPTAKKGEEEPADPAKAPEVKSTASEKPEIPDAPAFKPIKPITGLSKEELAAKEIRDAMEQKGKESILSNNTERGTKGKWHSIQDFDSVQDINGLLSLLSAKNDKGEYLPIKWGPQKLAAAITEKEVDAVKAIEAGIKKLAESKGQPDAGKIFWDEVKGSVSLLNSLGINKLDRCLNHIVDSAADAARPEGNDRSRKEGLDEAKDLNDLTEKLARLGTQLEETGKVGEKAKIEQNQIVPLKSLMTAVEALKGDLTNADLIANASKIYSTLPGLKLRKIVNRLLSEDLKNPDLVTAIVAGSGGSEGANKNESQEQQEEKTLDGAQNLGEIRLVLVTQRDATNARGSKYLSKSKQDKIDTALSTLETIEKIVGKGKAEITTADIESTKDALKSIELEIGTIARGVNRNIVRILEAAGISLRDQKSENGESKNESGSRREIHGKKIGEIQRLNRAVTDIKNFDTTPELVEAAGALNRLENYIIERKGTWGKKDKTNLENFDAFKAQVETLIAKYAPEKKDAPENAPVPPAEEKTPARTKAPAGLGQKKVTPPPPAAETAAEEENESPDIGPILKAAEEKVLAILSAKTVGAAEIIQLENALNSIPLTGSAGKSLRKDLVKAIRDSGQIQSKKILDALAKPHVGLVGEGVAAVIEEIDAEDANALLNAEYNDSLQGANRQTRVKSTKQKEATGEPKVGQGEKTKEAGENHEGMTLHDLLKYLEHQLSTVQAGIRGRERHIKMTLNEIRHDNAHKNKDRSAVEAAYMNGPYVTALKNEEKEAIRLEKEIARIKAELALGNETVTIGQIPKKYQREIANMESMLESEYTVQQLRDLGIPQDEIDSWLADRKGKKEGGKPAVEATIDEIVLPLSVERFSEECAGKTLDELKEMVRGAKTAIETEIVLFYLKRAKDIERIKKIIKTREGLQEKEETLEFWREQLAELMAQRWAPAGGSREAAPKAEGVVVDDENSIDKTAEITEAIKNVKSFPELFTFLTGAYENLEIWGTQQRYTGAELVVIIQAVRDGSLFTKYKQVEGSLPIEYITRTAGLREKVVELLAAEQQNNPASPTEPPLPQPKTPETADAMQVGIEIARVNLDATREVYMQEHMAYIKARKNQGMLGKLKKLLGLGVSAEKEEDLKPESLKEAKAKYELAKEKYGQALYDAKKESLDRGELDTVKELAFLMKELRAREPGKPEKYYEDLEKEKFGGQLTAADKELLLNDYRGGDIFKAVVLDERQALLTKEAETWTPKQKSLWMKAFSAVTSKKGRMVRLAGTVLYFGAAGALSGGALAGLSFAGGKLVRMGLGIGFGQLVSKGFDKVFKDKSETTRLERIRLIKDQFSRGVIDAEKAGIETQKAEEDAVKERNSRMLFKGILLAAAGAGFGGALSHFGTGVEIPHGPTTGVGAVPREIQPPINILGAKVPDEVPTENINTDYVPGPNYNEEPQVPWDDEGTTPNLAQVDPKDIPAVNSVIDKVAEATPEVDPYDLGENELSGIGVGDQNGHDLWHIIGNELEKIDNFKALSKAGQVSAIDDIYQKYVHMSKAELQDIGIKAGNLNKMHDGEFVDLSAEMTPENVRHAIEHAQTISYSDTVHINHNVGTVESFKMHHPRTEINERVVNKLLSHANHTKH